MLALNTKGELNRVLLEAFSNTGILELYRKKDSYIWQNRKDLLDCIEIFYKRPQIEI
jgi:hypothetical protein